MSASETAFVFPLEEHDDDPTVEAYAYECGYVELRSGRSGEWLNTDKPVHTRDFR